MIKGIIFDMDGVMIDTENQSNLGWLWAASQKNVEMPLWLIDSFKGAPAKLSQSFFDDYYHGEQDYWEMRTMRTDMFTKSGRRRKFRLSQDLVCYLIILKIMG